MALHKLEVYKSANKDNALKTSLLGISNGFIINLCHNDFHRYNSQYWRLNTEGFTGIMLDNLSLNFQTNWNDAGGAILSKKIESVMNSKFIKMLASQADEGFKPFICSDAWTQQKVSGEAQPVKVQLKFKAYNTNKMGCTNYNDILRFLIHICSPLKSTTGSNDPNILSNTALGSQLVATLDAAADGGGNIIGMLGGAAKTFMSGDKSSISNVAKTVVETADATYNKLLSNTGNGKNNANFTVEFRLGDINNPSNLKINSNTNFISKTLDENHKETSAKFKLDWIVSNFTFKPSMQFEMVKEGKAEYPKPLWMDFDVTLETRLSLSNKYVYQTLITSDLATKINP